MRVGAWALVLRITGWVQVRFAGSPASADTQGLEAAGEQKSGRTLLASRPLSVRRTEPKANAASPCKPPTQSSVSAHDSPG